MRRRFCRFFGSIRVWDERFCLGDGACFSVLLHSFQVGRTAVTRVIAVWFYWHACVHVVVVVVAEPHPLPTAISPVFDSRRQPKTAHPSFRKPGRLDFSRHFWQNCHQWNIFSDLYWEEGEEKKILILFFCLMFYFYELCLANCIWNVYIIISCYVLIFRHFVAVNF